MADETEPDPMSILYIDDDIEDIEIFQEAISAVNPSIRFESARSGVDALAMLRGTDTPPTHIVLDVNMPGMDGKLCLKEIRSERRFDPIEVIIYSTNSFPRDITEMEALGARFVRKANSFDDLCNMIRELASK